MIAQIDVFLRLLLKSCQNDEVIDMTERTKHLATDVIGHLAFGYAFNTQNEDRHRFLPNLINGMSWRINTYMSFTAVAFLEQFLALLGIREILKFGDVVKTMIKTRMAEAKDAHNDLYSYVADDIGKGPQGFYYGELWPEAILFITAGNMGLISLHILILLDCTTETEIMNQ